ncbi:MAG: methyltransferase domain-containing protein [Gemmatimonadetes bacterium]|nr:methyltransferase domain-containing protein [Gemmatimonadota bacterium]
MQDRVAERAFYDQLFARNPENEHITAGYDELHALAFPEPPRGKVFDIGCGTGGHAIRLARRGYDVIAMDLTKGGVMAARERFRRENRHGLFLVGDAENLPIRHGAIDVAWTSLLLHHFPRLDKLPRELARVTRNRIVAFEPNAKNFLTWLAFNVVNRYGWWALKKMVRNQRALWPASVERIFRAQGFSPTALHYVDRQWTDGMSSLRKTYQRLTSWLPLEYRANKFLILFQKNA